MTVWVVLVGDGNVCCPAEEFDSVWSSEEAAFARAAVLSKEEYAKVIQCMLDAVPEGDGIADAAALGQVAP